MEEVLRQRPTDCLKIVLFGPESTGKTTLATALAEHFNQPLVPEYMRGYAQQKWDKEKAILQPDDLYPIAQGQMSGENNAAQSCSRYVFCDTNLLELKTYSEYYFDGFCPEWLTECVNEHSYDLYFLTDIDVPWEADDLRDRPGDRLALFHIFEAELKKRELPYIHISGSHEHRFETALQALKKLTPNVHRPGSNSN